ncbi:MAG: hypothetical protein ABIT07_13005, partial [Ferruginibacter sp.]
MLKILPALKYLTVASLLIFNSGFMACSNSKENKPSPGLAAPGDPLEKYNLTKIKLPPGFSINVY